MLTTTRHDVHVTITQGGNPAPLEPNELVGQYQQILAEKRLNWTSHLRLLKLLGSGGQGVVYQTELRGTDEFTLPADEGAIQILHGQSHGLYRMPGVFIPKMLAPSDIKATVRRS